MSASSTAASLSSADATSLIDAGQACERDGNPGEARGHFEAALARLRGGSAAATAAALTRWIGRTHAIDGDHDAALDCVEASLAIARATGDRAAEGHAINTQAAVYWLQGDQDAAEAHYRLARDCALAAGDLVLVGMTSNNLGIIANIRGDFAESLHHYGVCLDQNRSLRLPKEVCQTLINMGRLQTDLESWEAAERAFEEAIALARQIGDRALEIAAHVNFAEMWLARGDIDRASRTIQVSVDLSHAVGDTMWLAEIARLRGTIARRGGRPAEAERHLSEAVSLAEARQDLLLIAEALRERAELYRGEGRNREALQNLNRAHRLFTQMRAKRYLANVDRSVSRLEGDFVRLVARWGESIEAIDHYTQGHCERVADVACAIAVECGIQGQDVFWFRIGALLHDVGKLVVPPAVLNKPGQLTDDEWKLMRSHPTAGVDMLAGIDFPWDVRPIIESHHERWDGRGYPHGLSGEEIPLSARILAIADVYDALTSVRSYKPAFSHDKALDIMRAQVGAAFDPAVFAKFEQVMQHGVVPASAVRPTPAPDREAINPADDALTRVPTRDSMHRIARYALGDARATKEPLSLLVVQLDSDIVRAQAWSERHRHRVLGIIADELRRATRISDFVARTSELQLMTLLINTSPDQAAAISRRIELSLARRLSRTFTLGDVGTMVRLAAVSACGVGDSVADLFARAEQAVLPPAPLRRYAS